MGKKFSLTLAIIFVLLFSGCTQQQIQNNPTFQSDSQSVFFSVKVFNGTEPLVDKRIVAEKGANALEALKQATEVETQSAAFGEFVTALAGVKADSTHYWSLYVDGKYAEKGIGQYALDKDTSIEWRLEEIK